MLQKTIKASAACEGTGLHTGNRSKAVFHPAKDNSGIVFVVDGKEVPAKPENVSDTKRGTSLKNISTVEHALAAVNGLGIDNIIIEILGNELPALDGSALGYVKALETAGITEQKSEKRILKPSLSIYIDDNGADITLLPSDRLVIEVMIFYPEKFIGRQKAVFDESINDFKKDIAPARTFGHLKEAEALKERGLAKGASFDNVIAIHENGFSSPLRFPNELARHKILDIMGDIALAGAGVCARIVSNKAGHKQNIELVRRLLNAS